MTRFDRRRIALDAVAVDGLGDLVRAQPLAHVERVRHRHDVAGRGARELLDERPALAAQEIARVLRRTGQLLFLDTAPTTRLDVDAFFLEYDTDRAGGFEPLRYIPKGKRVVLGLISSKLPDLEKKDDLKRRIEAAAKYVPLENLCLSPQCGFSSTHHGNKITVDDQRRKLALALEVADEVWGSN